MTERWKHSRKGKLNRSSVTVRLAFHDMKFDAIHEWVTAFRQLDKEIENAAPDAVELRFAIIKEKLAKLEKAFDFLYPKITGADLNLTDLLELEAEQSELKRVNPADKSTEELLDELNGSKET